MSAARLLNGLYRRGVRFRVDGDRLRWLARVGVVSEDDLLALRCHKTEALEILRDEMRDRTEERAAILQFDSGLSRTEADRLARSEVPHDQRQP